MASWSMMPWPKQRQTQNILEISATLHTQATGNHLSALSLPDVAATRSCAASAVWFACSSKSPSSRIQCRTGSRSNACRSACGKENRNGQLSQKQSFPSWLRTSNYIHFSDILRTESSFTLVFDLLSAELTFHFLPNNVFLPYLRNIQNQHKIVTWQNRDIPRLTNLLYFHG